MKNKKKSFDGKAIYNPKGKAREYSKWACNFHTGCSNNCEYCYCKKGFLGRTWDIQPRLKKCFVDELDAFNIFKKELQTNISELRKDGLFFTFTSDPMLPSTKEFIWDCVCETVRNEIPVQLLTKRADFIDSTIKEFQNKEMVAFGFTLTGCDELEPDASSNADRIKAMEALKRLGYRTFASIEPIINPEASMAVINACCNFCDLFKVGVLSGKKEYDKNAILFMLEQLNGLAKQGVRFYLKDSFVQYINLDRASLGTGFVTADFNINNIK